MKVQRVAFWVVVLALLVAHLDVAFIEPGGAPTLFAGWIPADLAYHLLWIVGAAGLVFWMAGRSPREWSSTGRPR